MSIYMDCIVILSLAYIYLLKMNDINTLFPNMDEEEVIGGKEDWKSELNYTIENESEILKQRGLCAMDLVIWYM